MSSEAAPLNDPGDAGNVETGKAWFSLVGDDLVASVLSYLTPADVAACACTSRRLRQLAADDLKVWLPMCQRRWGACTSVHGWAACGTAQVHPFRKLYDVLSMGEDLLGFWRGVGEGAAGYLLHFKWGRACLEGSKVLPARDGSYSLRRATFIWMLMSEQGLPEFQVDIKWQVRQKGELPPFPHPPKVEPDDVIVGSAPSALRTGPLVRIPIKRQVSDPQQQSLGLSIPPSTSTSPTSLQGTAATTSALASPCTPHVSPHNLQLSDNKGIPIRQGNIPLVTKLERQFAPSPSLSPANSHPYPSHLSLSPLSVSKLRLSEGNWQKTSARPAFTSRLPPGITPVDVSFAGLHHIVVEELPPQQQQRSPLVEAATMAAFGSNENLAGLATGSPQGGARGVGEMPQGPALDICSQSPPGTLPYEMYQFLASRVATAGSERAARKQRRRDRERAVLQGRAPPPFATEHFVRVLDFSPTRRRPLQGLWKGLTCRNGLEVILITYEAKHIVCRSVLHGELPRGDGVSIIGRSTGSGGSAGNVQWTAEISSYKVAPLSAAERDLHDGRLQIGGKWDIDLGDDPDYYEDQLFVEGSWHGTGRRPTEAGDGSTNFARSDDAALDSEGDGGLQFAGEGDGEFSQPCAEDVLGLFRTIEGHVSESPRDVLFQQRDRLEGRIWHYQNGQLGYGTRTGSTVIMYKRLASSEGCGLDGAS